MVLSGEGGRAEEARASAEALLEGVPESEVIVRDFRDGFFPYEGRGSRTSSRSSRPTSRPTSIFTHQRADLHQDHRTDAAS